MSCSIRGAQDEHKNSRRSRHAHFKEALGCGTSLLLLLITFQLKLQQRLQ